MISNFKYIFIIAALLFSIFIYGQELNCNVQVNAEMIQTSEREVFRDMETAFSQFMSTRNWTNDVILPQERINCNIIITINTMPNIGSFSASVQIQSARPIYNSNYESIIFNFADREWDFEYVQSQPIEYTENNYINNLSSLLAYYAYIIIGLDYDSFGELSGAPYFQIAQNIVNNAQQANRTGWDSFGSTRNRYWLVENINRKQFENLRRGLYKYHRLALDQYEEKPEEARKEILLVLREMKRIKDRFPNSILVISFLDAKTTELINIFSEGSLQTRREVFNLLTQMDPSQTDAYKKILN
ncbi:MAG: DUF4835 family protein [Cyclobacteriaceae bacterium]|nr:DUF4835 family protein [Cyclobacteriaceae bacterium]